MTDLDLQRRCAELAGWTDLKWELIYGAAPEVLTGVRDDVRKLVPDYPDDLNAVRELEGLLTGIHKWRYIEALTKLQDMNTSEGGIYGPLWAAIFATAEQRCRAFVEVMSDD